MKRLPARDQRPLSDDVSASDDAAMLAAHFEEELARYARLLHDGLAQQLTAASIELSLWKHEIQNGAASSTEGSQAKIAMLTGLISQSLAAAREITAGMRPRTLDAFGFGAVFEGMVARLKKRLGVVIKFHPTAKEFPIDGSRAIHLVRILESWFGTLSSGSLPSSLELTEERGAIKVVLTAGKIPALPPEAASRLRIFRGAFEEKLKGEQRQAILLFPTGAEDEMRIRDT